MTDIVLPTPNTPAFRIVQQPNGEYAFVSDKHNTVTQFSFTKENNGALAFLSHNTGAGSHFSKLKIGDVIGIKSDTPTHRGGYSKTVKEIRKFQALDPGNVSSDFVDIETKKKYTTTELYDEIYANPKNLVMQTCISKKGNNSWGRLFVVAGDD